MNSQLHLVIDSTHVHSMKEMCDKIVSLSKTKKMNYHFD